LALSTKVWTVYESSPGHCADEVAGNPAAHWGGPNMEHVVGKTTSDAVISYSTSVPALLQCPSQDQHGSGLIAFGLVKLKHVQTGSGSISILRAVSIYYPRVSQTLETGYSVYVPKKNLAECYVRNMSTFMIRCSWSMLQETNF